jgi:hypothetical protein
VVARSHFPEKYVGREGSLALLKNVTETAEGAMAIVNKEGADIIAIFCRRRTALSTPKRKDTLGPITNLYVLQQDSR